MPGDRWGRLSNYSPYFVFLFLSVSPFFPTAKKVGNVFYYRNAEFPSKGMNIWIDRLTVKRYTEARPSNGYVFNQLRLKWRFRVVAGNIFLRLVTDLYLFQII